MSYKSTAIATAMTDIVKKYYGIYATYVIKNRAIPDVRDGLKPVHRRIIYGAYNMGARAPNKMVKCAKIVGEVMGNYHPHGDSSIYDTLVRLTQAFNMRIPLFDGQGNFGSVDGDSAAAQRYTEARLNRIATEMFCNELNDEIVPFVATYDNTRTEPTVLPSELPHFILNNNYGIAVGIGTNVASCCSHEIIDCLIAEIDEKIVTNGKEKAISLFKGPDLPTSGAIEYDEEALDNLWSNGGSRWNIRGEAKFETDEASGMKRVVIISLPFQLKKEKWLGDVAQLVTERDEHGKHKIEGIADMRDESNKDGIRIVFDLKSSADSEVVLNQLYKRTKLQRNISTSMIAIVDGKPKNIGVREVMLIWLDFRRECIRKILTKEKKEKEERIETIDGFIIVHANIEEIIKVIRGADDSKAALIEAFKFTDRQATSVVAMRLGSLRKLDEDSLKTERDELQTRVNEITKILKDPKLVDELIKNRLVWWKGELNDRQTQIVREFGEIELKDTIVEQDVVMTISYKDEVKVTPVHEYRKVKNKGSGVKSVADAEDDGTIPRLVVQVTTHDMLYAFTDASRVFEKPCHELSITKRMSKATIPIDDLFPGMKEGEHIVDIIAMNIEEMGEEASLMLVRSNGNVKKISCRGLLKKRGRLNGEECCRTDLDESSLVSVSLAPVDSDMIIFTKNGLFRRIKIDTLRMATNRQSGAPKCLGLKGDDKVIDVAAIRPGDTVVSISSNGYGARFKEEVLPFKKGRAGGGMKLANADEMAGHIVFGGVFTGNDEDIFLTTSGGKSLRIGVAYIKDKGRGARGVIVSKLKDGETIITATKVGDI